MRTSKRTRSIAGAAAVLAVAVAVALLVALGPLGPSSSQDAGSCSSYPGPGQPAPTGTKVSAALAMRYALLRAPQRSVDRLTAGQVSSLQASGLIMSGTRFLGDTPTGGRIYLVPAQSVLTMRVAPARCLSGAERSIEEEALPLLRREQHQPALCIAVLHATTGNPQCQPITGTPFVFSATGTTGFGLVPDGISAATLTYQTAPPRTLAVRHNFFSFDEGSHATLPCGLQWLDATGNVETLVSGCSYQTSETYALNKYRKYVASKLATLQSQVAEVSAAVGSGNIDRARADWLAAHLSWLDIGQDDGAYGCFGPLGGQIDGLAAGHPLGTADPGFTGFHRIEFDLWTRHDLRAAAADTATLQSLLARLMKAPLATYLPATATGLGNWVLRPHEVLEDALRDSLTADDDYGSDTDLASITADVAAVRELLSVLGPTIDPVAPGLVVRATGELDSLSGAIAATGAKGASASLYELTTRQRQQIDADVGAALETLAPIPDLVTSMGPNIPDD